jgi:hypothetical protein
MTFRVEKDMVAAVDEPYWIVVRSTVPLPGLPRDHVATVDATLPQIRQRLRNGYLVPMPASMQTQTDHPEVPDA